MVWDSRDGEVRSRALATRIPVTPEGNPYFPRNPPSSTIRHDSQTIRASRVTVHRSFLYSSGRLEPTTQTPLFAIKPPCISSDTVRPTMASPRSSDTSASTLGLLKCVTAWTMARARLTGSPDCKEESFEGQRAGRRQEDLSDDAQGRRQIRQRLRRSLGKSSRTGQLRLKAEGFGSKLTELHHERSVCRRGDSTGSEVNLGEKTGAERSGLILLGVESELTTGNRLRRAVSFSKW